MYTDVTIIWYLFAFVYLCRLTWQDYRKLEIDERHNYFMMGITFSLIAKYHPAIWYILGMIVLFMVYSFILSYKKLLADGDIQGLSWLFMGFGFISFLSANILMILIFMVTGLVVFIRDVILKQHKPTPFYGMILICFMLTALITIFTV